MKKYAPWTALLAAALPLLWAQVPVPKLPEPFHSESVNNRPQVVPRPEGAQLQLPKGFSIDVFSEGFQRPRFMVEGPRGEILVSDSVKDGSVFVLQDQNGDGRPEGKKEILKGLDRPFGMAFWNDYLYVAETTAVKRFKYDAAAQEARLPGEEVVPMKEFAEGHWTRNVLFDRQGRKMYVAIGSASNVSTGEDPRRAAINRYNPDGSGHEILASGLRNPIGLRWYPDSDVLWTAVQERDGLGDDLVPDYFTSVKQGEFYGWPYAYIGPHEDPRNKGARPDLVKKTLVPDVVLGSHVAVLDALFYTGSQFPAQYRKGAFLAQHGSWNRSKRVGYSVVFVPFRDGRPAGPEQDFLTGFMLDPDKREVWGRPVGLFQMKDGSLLVSDDGGNKIWRISYR